MISVFLSILPVFLLIVTGYVAKKMFIQSEDFWSCSDKLVYYIFFPCLLVLQIGSAEFDVGTASTGLLIALLATIFVGFTTFLYKQFLTPDGDLFTSVFQGGIRYNSYIFIASSEALFGASGVALSGVFIAVMIVSTNIASVIVMNQYGDGAKKNIFSVCYKTLTNPLIIGALVGIILNFLNLSISGAILHFMQYLSTAATPLSLMSVGAGLILALDNQKKIAISYAIFSKLIVLPVVAVSLVHLFDLKGIVASITLLYCAVPCAGNAYILSRQMGGDTVAMASIITWGTLLSSFTMPIFMVI